VTNAIVRTGLVGDALIAETRSDATGRRGSAMPTHSELVGVDREALTPDARARSTCRRHETHLILTPNSDRSREVAVRLDMLSRKWDEIVRLVEDRLGRTPVQWRSGPFRA
jgi:hypothetical protein